MQPLISNLKLSDKERLEIKQVLRLIVVRVACVLNFKTLTL